MPAAPDRIRRRLLTGALAGLLAPPGAYAQTPLVITDAAGRTIRLAGTARRIYAAGPPASILVYAVAPDSLIGWTSPFRPDERPFVPERYASLPTLGRLTGRGNTANVEVVLAAKPDLVFDYGTVGPTFASLADRVQAQTGIPYVLLDGSFDRMPAAFTAIGELSGETRRAGEWARYATDALAEIQSRVAKLPPERRQRVYYGRGPQGLQTGLAGSINVENLERVGAVNVAAELGKGGLAQVSIEQVLRWNPDTIITTDPNFYQHAFRDPTWLTLQAVKQGRVFLAPGLPFGWIDFPPSINRLIGLRWLAKVLYPTLFPEDLRPLVRDFYERAYHQVPTDPQLGQLLASAERARP